MTGAGSVEGFEGLSVNRPYARGVKPETLHNPPPRHRATRVRKARKSSRVACGHYVLVGQVIVYRASRWICLPCALAAIGHKTSTEGTAQ